MVFENGVKTIQAAAYNGAHTEWKCYLHQKKARFIPHIIIFNLVGLAVKLMVAQSFERQKMLKELSKAFL